MVTEPATGLRFVELSHEWGHYTPAFPGYTDIQIHRVATIAKQGVLTQHIVTSIHHGTHLNAPIHLAQRGAGVGELPFDAFFGTGVVLDVPKGEWEYIEPVDLAAAGEVQAGGTRPARLGAPAHGHRPPGGQPVRPARDAARHHRHPAGVQLTSPPRTSRLLSALRNSG